MPKATQRMTNKASICCYQLASKTPNHTSVSPPRSSRHQRVLYGTSGLASWTLWASTLSQAHSLYSTLVSGPHWAPGRVPPTPLSTQPSVIFLHPPQLGVPAPHLCIQGHSPLCPCLLLQPQVLASTARPCRAPRVLQGLTSFIWFPSLTSKLP